MLYRVQNHRNCGRYIGSMPIYQRFWMKNAISVGCVKSLRLGAVNAISAQYRGYIEDI